MVRRIGEKMNREELTQVISRLKAYKHKVISDTVNKCEGINYLIKEYKKELREYGKRNR